MNTIEALQPFIRVFQLLGMSVTRFSTLKYIPIHRVIKYYSILLILIRSSTVWSIVLNYKVSVNSKFNNYIDKIILGCGHFLEISILIEAVVKARQEEMFLKNFLDIDSILMRDFSVDLKLNKLKKSVIKRMIIWMFIVGIACSWIIFTHYNTQYIPHALIWILSMFTSSFTYFQIITWADLIRYRLHIVNRLINELKCEHNEKIENQLKMDQIPQISHESNASDRQTICIDQIENANQCSNAIDDTQTFDQLSILCDVFNRLWVQTSILNERFKFSMVLNVGNDFAYLVVLLYYIIGCLRNMCDFLGIDIATSFVYIFHFSMLSIAGQNIADETRQIAYAIHRHKSIRSSTKLSSFVRLISHNCFPFLSKPSERLFSDSRILLSVASSTSATQRV